MRTYEERERVLEELIDNKRLRDALINMGFLTCPASTKYHGAYEGGLFDHCEAVAKTLVELSEDNKLLWQLEGSPILVGLMHDICKLDNYKINLDTGLYEYKKPTEQDFPMGGHGMKSIVMIQQLFAQHGVDPLSEQELLCIRYHMGAYEKDDWEGFDAAIKRYPAVLWTHHADMIASKVIGV